jgi:O-antigen ligase
MLPLAAQLPGAAILTLILLYALRIADSRSARFVIFACWLRFMLSAFHVYTFPKIVAGLSGNALASAAVCALGLALLPPRLLLSKAIVPVYLLLATIALSAVANGRAADGIDALVKFVYFIVIALHAYCALQKPDPARFTKGLLLAFSPLLLFQLLSVLLNVGKVNREDESVSYIGGYDHEAAFSLGLVGLFLLVCLSDRLRPSLRFLIGLAALAGVLLANYRTAIIGVVPLLLYLGAIGLGRCFEYRLRPLVIGVTAAALALVAVVSVLSFDRFVDLRLIAEGEATLIKPPEQFTPADRDLLNGRSYLWSSYYYGWKEGGEVQTLVGFGPNSWRSEFRYYAHNSFVSFLYEYGIVGVMSLILLFGTGLAMALQTEPGERARMVAAHLSFLLLNFATMPMWQIEGLIVYAILWGFTIDKVVARRFAYQAPLQPGSPLPWNSAGVLP